MYLLIEFECEPEQEFIIAAGADTGTYIEAYHVMSVQDPAYSELARRIWRYESIFSRDMRTSNIDTDIWADFAFKQMVSSIQQKTESERVVIDS